MNWYRSLSFFLFGIAAGRSMSRSNDQTNYLTNYQTKCLAKDQAIELFKRIDALERACREILCEIEEIYTIEERRNKL